LHDVAASHETVAHALARGAGALARVGIEEARLEAELLVGEAMGRSREWLFLHPDETLTREEAERLDSMLSRRLRREPLPYIVGHAEFYGLTLRVTPAAIIPRPETEILVEQAVARARAIGAKLAVEVGTGCGAIAVALAKQMPELRVLAVDISRDALHLARQNCQAHRVADRVALVRGDLMSAIRGQADCIAANLPYIRDDEFPGLDPEVRDWEPRRGLDGGADGLEAIGRLSVELLGHLRTGGLAALEVGAGQARQVEKLLEAGGLRGIEMIADYSGIERVVIGWRKG